MVINRELIDAYLSGTPMDSWRERWYFTASTVQGDTGENVFTLREYAEERAENIRVLAKRIEEAVLGFIPSNPSIWDACCPGWQRLLDEAQVDMIVGFPEPYDAVVQRDSMGKLHIIFDLFIWTGYIGRIEVEKLVQNLITHKLFHVAEALAYPNLGRDSGSPEYLTQLDAITFDESFAHLVSYEGRQIDEIDWHSDSLEQVRRDSAARMRAALKETDAEAQSKNLYEAICGKYYEKFACMCGLLYLASVWEKEGAAGIGDCFRAGWKGFAARTIEDI